MAGPLSRVTTLVGDWKCAACMEWFTSPLELPWEASSDHHTYCSGCVVQQFTSALEYDFNWPASWSFQELNPQDFVSILSPEMLAQLQWKKTAMDALNASTVHGDVEGLVRGTGFQNCPKCHKVIYLDSGCNHITCKCTASFCFRCGQLANGNSTHWNLDGCPRYGDSHHTPTEAAEPFMDDFEVQRAYELTEANRVEVERWAWNVAMQTSDATLRHHMRGFTLPQTNAPLEGYIPPDQEHWGPVIAAMQAHNNMRGVTGADWAAVLQEDTHLESVAEMLTTFLDEALLEEHDTAQYISEIPRPQRATHHILSEAFLLRQPVGGVFNLNSNEDRVDAAQWLSSRINLSTVQWPRLNHPDNFAILAMGPGGTDDTETEVAEVLTSISGPHLALGTSVHFPQAGRVVTFNRIADSTILAHVFRTAELPREYHDFTVLVDMAPETAPALADATLLAWVSELLTAPQQILDAIDEVRVVAQLQRPTLRIDLELEDWIVEDEVVEAGDDEVYERDTARRVVTAGSEEEGEGEAPDPDVEVPDDNDFGVAIEDAEVAALLQAGEMSDEELRMYDSIRKR
jgi:hypothetical protein